MQLNTLTRLLLLSLTLVLVFLGSSSFTSQSKSVEPGGEYVPHEILVKFSPATKNHNETIRRLGGERIVAFAEVGWERVRLPENVSVRDGISRFRMAAGVEQAQPNFIYRTEATPNDPRFPELVGLKNTGQIGGTAGADIDAEPAWNITTGSSSVVVAILDLGVNYNHEDLSANMWRNPGETGTDSGGANKATNNIDDDGNGYIDDVFGIDTINHDSNPMDDQGHGTHVAGTIGAVGNNGIGVVGVNWSVAMMAIKTHDSAGNGTSASVIEGFQYAAMMRFRGVNVRVTNSSWGGAPEAPSFDQALKDAIDLAGNAGILNVCAAGNAANNNDAAPFYPASYDSPSIIAVAASDQSDDRAGFSSYGATSVDVAAPGVGILSTGVSETAYRFLSGTSMATPHVSGVAALMISHNRLLTRSQIKSIIMSTADPLPATWAQTPIASGRVNALRALQGIPTTNPIDDAGFFVTQHYQDFLGRGPDAGGLAYWTSQINSCGSDALCVRHRRIAVSGSFFFADEFQQTGSFVYRMYKASFGRLPTFAEFTADRALVQFGPNLEQSKQSFANNWVTRSEFVSFYPASQTPEQFVNKLFDTALLIPFTADRQAEIAAMQSPTNPKSRADVVRTVAEMTAFRNREFNPSFVLMQYFGYLRRDPDLGGYNFWLNVINNREPNNYPGMICSFITSEEYQVRFAPVVSRTNAECSQ